MSLTSPEDIEKWFEGTQLYDEGDIEGALKSFTDVTQNSRILFNVGCCYLANNDIKTAAESYQSAVEQDQHFAVGYFMIGLTYFLQQNYESAMTAFKKSLELLRGNRCVDYKQLGLNYQLYSCEILCNQAVIAYHLNQFDKAKEYLLEAVGCKAESRHSATFEMLTALQAGDEITPYILPQNQIFRPPKSYVQNLKKKDYLGEAAVITTENEKYIYACFSGIKDKIIKKNKKGKAESKIPIECTVTPQAKTVARSKMLNELLEPEKEKSLKKTVVEKKQPSFQLGRVIEGPQDSHYPTNDLCQSKAKKLKPKPKSPCPTRKSNSSVIVDYINCIPISRESCSNSPSSVSVESTKSLLNSLSGNEMRLSSSENNSERESEEDLYETIHETDLKCSLDTMSKGAVNVKHRFSTPNVLHTQKQRLQKSQKMQLSLPIQGSSPSLQRKRFSSTDIQSEREKRMSLAFVKPLKTPPPLLEAESEEEEDSLSVSSPDQLDSGIDRLSLSSDAQKSPNCGMKRITKEVDLNKKKVRRERKVEVEIQYTFVKKLRIPIGCDLHRLHQILKQAHVPDQMELCYEDSLGRQRLLSDEDIESVLFRPSKPQKIFCYPEI